jgi:beta-N-acetylhexosaminidase
MVFIDERSFKRLVSLATCFTFLLTTASSNSFATTENQTSIYSDPVVEKALRSLTVKQKVGQLFIFGFMGKDLSKGLGETLRKHQPGGIIVFGRNIQTARQLANLNYAAQSLSIRTTKVPLFIAVDQEGGSVIRVKTPSPLPSALAIGGTKRSDLAYDAGASTGKLLRTLGFTMNLAPVMDVSDPSDDNFIGTRTYGKDPNLVAMMGSSFADGLNKNGILPTAKHFPGHGGVSEDSHQMTPAKEVSLQELLQLDLLPFAQIAREKAPWAVMLAHISFPKLDPSGAPATFSKPIVTDLLRTRLGYNGVVMTDDIEMAGAAGIKSVGERAVKAIDAGADLVMLAWNKTAQAEAVEAVNKAVQTGRISRLRLDQSVRRILTAKRSMLSRPLPKNPSTSVLLASLKSMDLKKVSEVTIQQRLSDAAQELDRDFVLEAAERPIYIFSASAAFFKSFKSALPKAKVKFVHLGENTPDLTRLMRTNENALGVFYLSGPRSADYANQLQTDITDRVIVINTETAGLLNDPDAFRHIVDIHFRHPDLGKLTAQHFFIPKSDPIEAAETAMRLPASQE